MFRPLPSSDPKRVEEYKPEEDFVPEDRVAKINLMEFVHIKEAIAEGLNFIDRTRQSDIPISGMPTGFLELDKLTTGFHPGDFVVVASRPGMGKSGFMLSVALNLAFDDNVPVAIFSLENTKLQLSLKMLSILSGVPLQSLRTGFVSDELWSKLVSLGKELSQKPLYIDDSPRLTTTELREKSKRLREEKGVEVIFVDYLQLLRVPFRRSSRQEEVAEISMELKALAKELNIPVVALAQLSRQVEQRQDKQPQLADLRESRQIEQDADIVLFIHRPEYYKKNPLPKEEGIAEIIVAKHRYGPTGIVKLAFIKDTTAFKNYSGYLWEREEEVEREEETGEDLELGF